MSKNLFVTGTGTDVGKTYVSGLLLKKLRENGCRGAYFKAAMSGNRRRADGSLIPGDALQVRTVSDICQSLEEMCPYVYEHAVSPHLASQIEGNPVELERVRRSFTELCGRYDYITVEGSGGILCPITWTETEHLLLPELIRALDLGCLLVADAGLGTINSVLLTVRYLQAEQIPLRGIVLNHFEPGNLMHEDNRKMCSQLAGAKVLCCVEDGDQDLRLSPEELLSLYE